MKIGILTWFNAANYGAKAHSYGLQKKIMSLGYECEMINYYPKKMNILNLKMNMGREYSGGNIWNSLKGLFRCFIFQRENKKLIISSKVNNAEMIDRLGYDLIILGSDEIFNVEHPLFDSIFYGEGISTPCITYAPSSGQCNEFTILNEKICKSLNKMLSLSTRDIHTRNMIEKNVGRTPDIVMDPTFLWDYGERGKSFISEKYILVYSFSEWNDYANVVREYAKQKNYKIISIGRKIRWADKSYQLIGMDKWLSAFENAELVFTDSFHGTVFSIKNKKQFIIIGRHDKTNKIEDLLKILAIDRKFFEIGQNLDEYLDNQIDYDIVENKIKDEIKHSENYLNTAFEKLK